jgi:hypothetical protein
MSDENSVDATLEKFHHESFNYFLHETSPANGLVIDKNEANWPASIAASGLALAAYPVGIERGFMPRSTAGRRTLNTLHPIVLMIENYRSGFLCPLMRNCLYLARGLRLAGFAGGWL